MGKYSSSPEGQRDFLEGDLTVLEGTVDRGRAIRVVSTPRTGTEPGGGWGGAEAVGKLCMLLFPREMICVRFQTLILRLMQTEIVF